MAFVVKRIGKFLIIKIDRKIAKQPSVRFWRLMPCDWYDAVVLILWPNSIPDKFAQRDVSRFGLFGRTLLTVEKKNQSEIIFTG